MKVLGIVAARGGSKGLPRKNVRVLAGKPLIAWTAEAAQASRLDRTILSTDDDEIADAGRAAGLEVPFRRPAELATDAATAADVVLHALDQLPGFDAFVYLQPTSPLRTAEDIDACLALAAAADRVVSVRAAPLPPEWMFRLGDGGVLDPVLGTASGARRQDLPASYVLNGAVYVARVEAFRGEPAFVTAGTVGYVMPAERSIDIDDEQDFLDAENVVKLRRVPLSGRA